MTRSLSEDVWSEKEAFYKKHPHMSLDNRLEERAKLFDPNGDYMQTLNKCDEINRIIIDKIYEEVKKWE